MPKAKPKKLPAKPRVKKPRSYKPFKLARKIRPSAKTSVPYSWTLIKRTLSLINKNRRVFLGLLAVYVFLAALVRGFDVSADFASVKQSFDELAGGEISQAESAAGLYLYAVASSGSNAGGAAQAYQLFVTLITSLAVIWSARQIMAGEKIRLRDGFYKGMYPIVPFVLVLFVVSLQLVPALAGSFLLGTVLENGIAVTVLEKFLWLVIFGLLVLLSLYMVTSSLFALYVSALPDMTPMKALRSARELVRHRRTGIAVRILAGGLFLLLVSVAVVMPLIFVASWSVEWAVLILGGFSMVFFHGYMYKLYRALL
jgi:hypothetical protein